MAKYLLIVVDTQIDFIMKNGLLPIDNAEDIIAPLIAMIMGLDPDECVGVIFTFDTHEKEAFARSEEGKMFGLHCEKGTPGWENVINLNLVSPEIPTYTLEKGVFDMWEEDDVKVTTYDNPSHPRNIPRIFINRDRDTFFQEQKERGVEKIVVVGVAADVCVAQAIAGALDRGFEVEVPRHLTAGINRDIDAVCKTDFPGSVTILDEAA